MPKKKLASILGLAAILTLSALIQFTVVARTVSPFPVPSDASNYLSYAYNLKHHGIYSDTVSWTAETPPDGVRADALSPPGYPLFLLAVPGLAPTDAWLQRVYRVQAALGVGSVLLVFLLGATFLRPGWSHLAALVAAVNPHLATISSNLLTESVFLFLLLAATWATISAFRWRRTAIVLATGVLWGACGLVRSTVLFVPPLLLLATLALPALRNWRRAAGLLVLAFALVQLPWFVRNQVTPLDTSQGNLVVATLHHGSYPGFMYEGRPETLGWPFRFDPASEVAERDLRGALAEIARKARAAPLTYLRWYLLGKPGAFLSWGYVQGHDIYVYDVARSPYRDDARFALLRSLAFFLHWPLMLLGVVGALLAFWRPAWLSLEGNALVAARIVAAVVLYAIALHMVAAPYPRYGVPFRPLLYLMAAACVSAAFAGSRATGAPASAADG